MKLRTKLLLPAISISLLLLVFMIVIAGLGYRIMDQQRQADSEISQTIAQLKINDTLDSLLAVAQIIQSKESLVNSVALESQFEVMDALEPFSDQTMLDFAIVYDQHLDIFARSDDPGDFGHADDLYSELQYVVKSREAKFLMVEYEKQPAIIYMMPLESINGLGGMLVVGRNVNESFLKVRSGLQSSTIYINFDGKFLGEGQGGTLVQLDSVERLTGDGIHFYINLLNVEDAEFLLSRFVGLMWLVIVCSLFILYLSFRVHRQVSEKVSWVSDRAHLLVAGMFPEVPTSIRSKDEIGSMVTAIENANEAINTYIEDLSQSLNEKTVANQEMEKAKDAAIEMAIAKSQFLSNMSHEIRTPMNGVIGLLDVIDASPLSDEDKELVATAKKSGQDLIYIINDILTLSKLEVGKEELHSYNFSIKDTIQRDADLLAPAFEDQAIKFVVKMDVNADSEWVQGDGTRIGQVIKNLLGNALKFSREDGLVELGVLSKKNKEGKINITVTVDDEGIGIPQEQLELIFESFKQADGSVTRKYGGTGLGLAICRELVGLMNGEISVESIVGKGSRFTFSVLLDSGNPPDALKNVDEDSEANIYYFDRKKYRVLLVEDNAVNVLVAKNVLKKLGIFADLALNGQEAVDALTRKTYDLVLMDCQMPIMDGYDSTRKIRELKIKIPIIAMTANALPGDEERCLNAGMNDYISKPLCLEKVGKVVNKWLNQEYKKRGN